MSLSKTQVFIILAFLSIYIIWGSTYLFNKVAVTELPAFFLASIRFSTAGILMLSLAKVFKASLKITKNELKNSAIASFFFLILGNSVFVWALQFVDSGFAALIASTQPLFVLLILRIKDQKPMQKKSIIGVCLGILGMYLLISQQELVTSDKTILGIVVMLGCVLGWSYGSVFVSKAILPKNFLVSTGFQMII
ncbi:EamA family transporter, partial [Polaribacter sp.]|uniref:EamA family transporter n=1 Tax=Polaribacter sp. TaxID=1920175 RepID=UPI003F6C35A7